MPRIRTLKPEFWQDEKLAPLPPIDRLVFLGLISMADDAGRVVDNVKLIDGELFPATDDSSRDSLETLMRLSRILRYESESGQRLIQVVGWTKHQKVEHPSKYVLPAPSKDALLQLAKPQRVKRGLVKRSRRSPENGVRTSRDSHETLTPRPTTIDLTDVKEKEVKEKEKDGANAPRKKANGLESVASITDRILPKAAND